MIYLTRGNTEQVVLTLTEKVTITDANYLFVFTNRTTNEIVKFVVLSANDQSSNTDRFNQFLIDVDTYFSTANDGWFKYEIYEQASDSNLVVASAGDIIETGLMLLTDGSPISFTKYSQDITFKTYDAS